MIKFILETRLKINKWLWQRGIGTLKQRYGRHNRKPILIPYEKAIVPLRGRWWLLLGICIGYIPYVVHMQGWLK